MATQIKTKTKKKKKIIRSVVRGRMYITATFNNTLATVTDEHGIPLCWNSTGKSGFSGSRKSTPYAATITIDKVVNEAKNMGIKTLDVYIKGPGPGRDAALRVLRGSGISLNLLADVTPIPHNGTRPRKKKHNR